MSTATWEEAGAPLRIAIDAPLEEPAALVLSAAIAALALAASSASAYIYLAGPIAGGR